jgi:hypothetical protein
MRGTAGLARQPRCSSPVPMPGLPSAMWRIAKLTEDLSAASHHPFSVQGDSDRGRWSRHPLSDSEIRDISDRRQDCECAWQSGRCTAELHCRYRSSGPGAVNSSSLRPGFFCCVPHGEPFRPCTPWRGGPINPPAPSWLRIAHRSLGKHHQESAGSSRVPHDADPCEPHCVDRRLGTA